MFRLISLLVVVAIMAVLWLTVVEKTPGVSCDRPGATGSTTSLPVKLSPGVQRIISGC